jgi:solute carrier family 35 (UDP-xylose/UDP-N-acetylglucosamine transporter), member B4
MATKRKNVAVNGGPHTNGAVTKQKEGERAGSDETTSTSVLSDVIRIYLPTFGLIFGGCCSNVYALEALIKTTPDCGSLITAVQFLLTTLLTLPANVSIRDPASWRNAFLRKRQIPLRAWIIYTAFFLSINMLNNWAFSYRISVPLHIILRSAGPVTTMLVFYFFNGRRYPPVKILAVLLLFSGVVIAAASDAYSKAPDAFSERSPSASFSSMLADRNSAIYNQFPGFVLLFAALLLSAFMGLYSDGLYARYGRNDAITSESIFYSHGLSLPFFAFQLSTLSSSLSELAISSPPISSYIQLPPPGPPFDNSSPTTGPLSKATQYLNAIPLAIPMLLLNALTQYVCISGVNRLSTKSSSLTVSIVLNVRKLVSLLLSIWLFGNRLPPGVVLGAALVFLGGALYAVPTRSAGPASAREESLDKKER